MATSSTAARRTNPLTALLTGKEFIAVLRVLLGAVFVYSAWDKVLHPERFAIAVRAYEILPQSLTNVYALALAWAELLTGLLLVLGLYTRKAAAAILMLLLVFIVAIATTVVRGMVIDCGCFSNEGGAKTGYLLILRNLFLIAAALMVMRFENGFFALSRFASRRPRAA